MEYDFNLDNRKNRYTTTSSSYFRPGREEDSPTTDLETHHSRPAADNGLTSEEEVPKGFGPLTCHFEKQ